MKTENEHVFSKKIRGLPGRFMTGRRSACASTAASQNPGSGRVRSPRRRLAALLSLILLAALLFPHPRPPAHAQAVESHKGSDPAVDADAASISMTLGKQTLSEALVSQGISRSTIAQIARALGSSLDLHQLQPKDSLQLYYGPDGTLTRIVYRQSPLDVFEACRQENSWIGHRRTVDVDRRIALVAGTLENTLFESVEKLGERARLVFDFTEIFAWVFDFAADSQPGDRFRMLVEKLYVKDRFVQYGRILAAEYENGRTVHTAVYFKENEREDYYTPGGESLRRAFLKSPLEFSRITSGFNRNRPHPILGGVRPHLAIDYAAPVGTPVWAVADGTVAFAGWKNGYGKTIILNHKANYQTIYSHLSRFGKGIRSGSKVLQRQVIGYVGTTGVATGPHLDYRVRKDGRLVNPLKQTFLPGEPISPSAWPSFISTRDFYLKQIRIHPPGQTPPA